MFNRDFVFAPLSVLLCPVLLLAQFGGSNRNQPTSATLTVRVSFEDTRGMDVPLRVQLLTSMGTPISETFTHEPGEARFNGIPAGNYRVQVSGDGVDESSSTVSFTIYPRETNHVEAVRVVRRADDKPKNSNQGSVSAAELNIPDNARKEFERGIQDLDRKKFEEADKHLARATVAYPPYAAAINARGVIAMKTGKPADGQKFFQGAIDADRDFASAYVNLAKVFSEDKKFSEAESLLAKSISINPRDPAALTMLANLSLVLGKLDESVTYAQRVHELPHVDFAVVHVIAGMALERKNSDPEAAAQFKQFLQESPKSASAERVRAELASVEKRMH